MCPHILRYLTTAVITNKDVRKRRQVLKDLVKVIQQVRGGGATEEEVVPGGVELAPKPSVWGSVCYDLVNVGWEW